MYWLINKLLKIVMLAYINYFFSLEDSFSISRLKTTVIKNIFYATIERNAYSVFYRCEDCWSRIRRSIKSTNERFPVQRVYLYPKALNIR